MDAPNHREIWEAALALPPHPDLEASLIGELAEYTGRPGEEVKRDCRKGAEKLAGEWRASSPRTDEEVFAFYEKTGAYLYDLTRWHALADDESAALAGVEALECALDHRAREVLDFGSGIGSLGILFAKHGMDVSLAEINAVLSEYARHRFERRGLPVRFLDALSLPESAFDFVSAVDVLEHVPDPRSVLARLAASLRPGGTLFVHLPTEEDASRPMHLWHDPDAMLRNLGEVGMWLEKADGFSFVMRRGEAPRFSLSRNFEIRSTKRGAVLLSHRPLVAMRLNPRAAGLIEVLEPDGEGNGRSAETIAGEAGMSLPDATAFLEGLVEKRVAVREAKVLPSRWPSATVIVPARNRPSGTRACVKSLLDLDYPPDLLEVVVVDDASEVPLSESLSDLPVRVMRLEENAGQSAARNLAARESRGEILAFTDNDCVAEAGWLRALAARLCEPGTDVAGGRVLPPASEGVVAGFESVRSPLDMGMKGGPVGYGEAVAYVPSCNLAVDRGAMIEAGGFDEGMVLGEDVDFVWRLADAGKGVRYEPEAEVTHNHRTRLSELLRRRADYASSEADLQIRHPETRRSMMIPAAATLLLVAIPVSPVSWLASLGLVALAALLVSTEIFAKGRRLRGAGVSLPARKVAAAVMRQHGAGFYHLGANVARYYSLPLLAASIFWPALLPSTLLLMAVPAGVDLRRLRPRMPVVVFVLLYWLELAAYQIGVWRGCLERRTLRPLIPKLRFGR